MSYISARCSIQYSTIWYKLNVSSSNISGDIVNYELGTDAPFFRMVTIETPKFRYYKHDSGHHNHDFRKAETILV